MKTYTYKNNSLIIYSFLLITFFSSCESFIDVEPPISSVLAENVFTNDATATLAVTGMYQKMAIGDHFISGLDGVSVSIGSQSDEFDSFSFIPLLKEYDDFLVRSSNSILRLQWASLYNSIYQANAVLEGLKSSKGISKITKKQLEGEAKFTRALNYFYLVNTWGDVPLTTITDHNFNASLSRTPLADIYTQIITDLTEAQLLLSKDYFTSGRIRPNVATATALLARVYLYLEDWVNAEIQATAIIENPNYALEPLKNVFLIASKEAIWQISSERKGVNTFEGPSYAFEDVSISSGLQSSFEPGDNRPTTWITTGISGLSIPNKYSIIEPADAHTENFTPFRLAEQYLIRAEARAQINVNIAGVKADLNTIRTRAGLANTTATDKTSLLAAVAQERFVELFSELGHRWYDLKRTNRSNTVLASLPNWSIKKLLLPIPQRDIDVNPNLTQNPYNN